MRRKRRNKPLDIFLKTSFNVLSKSVEIQSDQIRAGYRREIDWGQSIGVGIFLGLLAVIFKTGF